MSLLKIVNPANGLLLAEVPADNVDSVAVKARAARAAQPGWAATPLGERKACIQRFRALLVAQLEILATTLTSEVGKPIGQSRNELNGLLARIDFFLDQVEASTAVQTVYSQGGMTERIGHDPLGLVANISACQILGNEQEKRGEVGGVRGIRWRNKMKE